MTDKRNRSTQIKVIVTAIIAVLTIIVVFQNTETVHTKVLFGTFSMPRAMLLAFTFTAGLLAGAVLCFYWNRRRKVTTGSSGEAAQGKAHLDSQRQDR